MDNEAKIEMAAVQPATTEPKSASGRERSFTLPFAAPSHKAVKISKFASTTNVALLKFLNSNPVQSLLAVMLGVSLFFPDIWVLSNCTDTQFEALNALLLLALILFSLECIVMSLCQPKYFLSFFFWMDVLGTISIIFDISWISEAWFSDDSSAGDSAQDQTTLLRAARAAKIGAKAGRLGKLARLFKYLFSNETEEAAAREPAKVISRKLSGLLARRVAALVMILVIIGPILTYQEQFDSPQASLHGFDAICLLDDGVIDESQYDAFWDFYSTKDFKPMTIDCDCDDNTGGKSWTDHSVNDAVHSRSRVQKASVSCSSTFNFKSVYKQQSAMSVLTIMMIIIVLVSFSASFNGAVDVLVVEPLERIMGKLKEQATKVFDSVRAVAVAGGDDVEELGDLEETLETDLLEQVIGKLAKIVELTMPGAESKDIDNAADLDSGTKEWLKADYTTAATSAADEEDGETKSDSERRDAADTARTALSFKGKDGVTGDELINSWDFDVLALKSPQLHEAITYIFSSFDSLSTFGVNKDVFSAFIAEVESRYIAANPYHNFFHAVDVCHTVWRFVCLTNARRFLTPLDIFCGITAAFAHDLGHLGYNNAFLVKSGHEWAMLHNDHSPLENMHCVLLYEICKQNETDIFSGLTKEQFMDARKTILHAILGTDMIHHFKMVGELQVFYEVNSSSTVQGEDGGLLDNNAASVYTQGPTPDSLKTPENRMFVVDAFLHAADISNPVKPFFICKAWAWLVIDEFCAQGDKEKELGLPISPMMDRNDMNRPTMQFNFLDFVVAPLYRGLVQVFPPLYSCGQNLSENQRQWMQMRIDELKEGEKDNGQEEVDKLQARWEKLKGGFDALFAQRSG